MNKKWFLKVSLIVFCFLITNNFASALVCPKDNGDGFGCTGNSYYCNRKCIAYNNVDWCLNFLKDNSAGNCHSGAPGCDGNCSGSDGCGICNQCDSGYLLCTGANFNKCAQVGSVPGVDANCSSCTWSGSNNYTCTACGAGYSLSGGECQAATVNLGPDSKTNSSVAGLSGLSPLVQSNQPFMYISGSGVTVGTSSFPMQTALNVVGASIFYNNLVVAAPTADNHAVTKGYVDDIVFSGASSFWASSTTGIYNIGLGSVGIGTSAPNSSFKLDVAGSINSTGGRMTGHLAMNNNNITGVNKLTVSVIDPLYNIDGVKYSTYAPSFVGGIKEEIVGRGRISQCSTNKVCSWQIDFSTVKAGSDLWVWRKVVDFNIDKVNVLLTAYGHPATLSYEIKDNKIIFYADQPTQFSYHLVGSRYDWRDWPTLAVDQAEETNLIIK